MKYRTSATIRSMSVTEHTTEKYDPDSFRMTIGEHLEELRRRMILALIGFVVIAAGCLWYGREVMSVFCAPLVNSLMAHDLSPQLHSAEVQDVFMSFITISLISAAAIAAPWTVYQLWQFVASGLYPNERKYITRFVPLSLVLLVGGMCFVYFLVLPWTLDFFIEFSTSVPLPTVESPLVETLPASPSRIDALHGDPAKPFEGQIWFNNFQKRVKIFIGGQTKVISFSAENLVATEYNLPQYIRLVVGMLLIFGLSFQTPLVVLALARIGIVDIQTLKAIRKYVYFAMAVLAALITPGDVITATIALMIPLCLLYELGIFLAVWSERRAGGPTL